MVTFVCYTCDRTLKKNQIERHTQCRPLTVICIDCSTTFYGQDYKAHTSCLSQQQKYFGEFANKKQNGQRPQAEEKKIQSEREGVKEQAKEIEMEVEEVQEEVVEEVEEQVPVWKWKNEIKRVIVEHENRIQYQELKKKVLKNYKKTTGESLSEETGRVFDEKVKKLGNVRLVTYVEL